MWANEPSVSGSGRQLSCSRVSKGPALETPCRGDDVGVGWALQIEPDPPHFLLCVNRHDSKGSAKAGRKGERHGDRRVSLLESGQDKSPFYLTTQASMCDLSELSRDELLEAIMKTGGLESPEMASKEELIDILRDRHVCIKKRQEEKEAVVVRRYPFKISTGSMEPLQTSSTGRHEPSPEFSQAYREVVEPFIGDVDSARGGDWGSDLLARTEQIVWMVDPTRDLPASPNLPREMFYFPDEIKEYTHACFELTSANRLCECSLFIVFFHGAPAGFVFTFYLEGAKLLGQPFVFMQTMTSTVPFFIAKQLVKDKLPKINDYLLPAVMAYAKERGASYIAVNPLEHQAAILGQHYGFVPAPIHVQTQLCGVRFVVTMFKQVR